jgi:uncharacterized membrane protein YgcG
MSTASTDTRRALAEMMRNRKQSSQLPIRRIMISLAVAAIVALLAMLCLWGFGFFRTAPEVLAVRTLVGEQVKHYVSVGHNEKPSSGENPAMGQIMEMVRDLPPNLRPQVERDTQRLFQAAMDSQVNSFFNLPPQSREAELDRRIKEQESDRKRRDAERAARGADDRQNAGSGGGGGGGGGPPGGGGRGGSEDNRNNWRKKMLDRTSPDERAKQTEYRRAMEERRQQLGLQPGRGGPR